MTFSRLPGPSLAFQVLRDSGATYMERYMSRREEEEAGTAHALAQRAHATTEEVRATQQVTLDMLKDASSKIEALEGQLGQSVALMVRQSVAASSSLDRIADGLLADPRHAPAAGAP